MQASALGIGGTGQRLGNMVDLLRRCGYSNAVIAEMPEGLRAVDLDRMDRKKLITDASACARIRKTATVQVMNSVWEASKLIAKILIEKRHVTVSYPLGAPPS